MKGWKEVSQNISLNTPTWATKGGMICLMSGWTS